MAKLQIQAGSTSQTVNIFIQDSSSITGAGLAGLVFNSAGLTAYYALPRAAAVSITLATLAAVTSSYSSGGFKEIDSTNMPGWYRFDVPDAAIASGRFVAIHLKGASNMAPLPLEIELTAVNNQDAVRGGMTALPNANAEASGGLYTRGTGAGQITQSTNGQIDVDAKKINSVATSSVTTVSANVGTTQPVNFTGTASSALAKVDAIDLAGQAITAAAGVTFPSSVASPTNITAGTITTVTNLTNAPTSGDFTSTMKTSLNAATPASVVGAVGSVMGNVGGNVVGSVASVTARVTANTDQLAGQTVTAGAGVTFPASVASPTNITAGTITTVTNLTNAPTNGDLTATMKASVTTAATAATPTAAAVTGNVGGNVVGSVGSVLAAVSITAGAVQSIWDALTSALTTTGSIGKLLTALPGSIWDVVLSGHTTSGTTGAALNSASSAGDPWNTALPGSYGSGTAGFIVGTNLDAAVSSRLAPAGTLATVTNLTNAPTNGDLTATMKASVATAVWSAGARTLTSFGTLVSDVATAVWAAGTRTLTAFGFTVAPTAVQNADALLGRNIAGGSTGGRTVSEALYPLRNKVDTQSVPGSLIVYETDDTTEAFRSLLTTNPAAEPIVTSDPTT